MEWQAFLFSNCPLTLIANQKLTKKHHNDSEKYGNGESEGGGGGMYQDYAYDHDGIDDVSAILQILI